MANEGKGWHGNTPGHKEAATRTKLSKVLRTPMKKESETEFVERIAGMNRKIVQGNFPAGAKELYSSNSAKGAFTFKEFVDVEIDERGNYGNLDIPAIKQKYGLTDSSKVLWVTPEKWIANRYNLSSDEYDDAENIPEEDMSVYAYTPEQGFIIPETNDGDEGYLFVFGKQGI